jgi:malonyl CoA-acyl carrier protein transacylase
MGQSQLLVIELARFGGRARFFQQIDRIRSIAMPAILVVVGTPEQLSGLEADIQTLSEVDGSIRIVPVQIDNG